MAAFHEGQVTVNLTARTGLARAFIALVSVPVFFGWKPSAPTVARLAAIASRLVGVEVTVAGRRGAITLPPKDGWVRRMAGPRWLGVIPTPMA